MPADTIRSLIEKAITHERLDEGIEAIETLQQALALTYEAQSALRVLGVDLAFVLSAATHDSARSSAKQAVRTAAQIEALTHRPIPDARQAS